MKEQIPPEIKTPCPKLWQEMRGDTKTRFCDHCQLHVQNLSALSRREVERVIARSQTERVCVTYTRCADGSLVTRWETTVNAVFGPMRRGLAWVAAAFVPILLNACETQTPLMGEVGPSNTHQKTATKAAEIERVIVTGGI